jgi:hypothetical protein
VRRWSRLLVNWDWRAARLAFVMIATVTAVISLGADWLAAVAPNIERRSRGNDRRHGHCV